MCTCRWTKLVSEAGWDDIGTESMPGEGQSPYAVPVRLAEPGFAHPRPVSRAEIGLGTGLSGAKRPERSKGLAADAVQRGLQILRIGAAEVDSLAARGMLEPETDRMQPLTLQTQRPGQHRVCAVGQVPYTGMAQR